MRKTILFGLLLTAINAVAIEAQIKGGYDLGHGFVVGGEVIPFSKGMFELGVGAEHNFSIDNPIITKATPIYGLAKLNILQNNDGDSPLYVSGRVGYSFNKATPIVGFKVNKGIYYGAGVGTEIGMVVVEGVWDSVPYANSAEVTERVNKFGIRAGIKFGSNKKSAPKIKEKNKIMPVACFADEKKCVIHGFKVDYGVPNAQEIKEIRNIAKTVNEFAVGGFVSVVGHTDSTGSVAYNDKLSLSRAKNVAKLLRENGLKEDIVFSEIAGKGEHEPIDTNETIKGKYNNRRVELFFEQVY